MPKEGLAGDDLKYENLARDMGVELGGWSFGAQFADLNNDGNLDLYLTNGNVSLDHSRNYWYDFSRAFTATPRLLATQKLAYDGRSQLVRLSTKNACG